MTLMLYAFQTTNFVLIHRACQIVHQCLILTLHIGCKTKKKIHEEIESYDDVNELRSLRNEANIENSIETIH